MVTFNFSLLILRSQRRRNFSNSTCSKTSIRISTQFISHIQLNATQNNNKKEDEHVYIF